MILARKDHPLFARHGTESAASASLFLLSGLSRQLTTPRQTHQLSSELPQCSRYPHSSQNRLHQCSSQTKPTSLEPTTICTLFSYALHFYKKNIQPRFSPPSTIFYFCPPPTPIKLNQGSAPRRVGSSATTNTLNLRQRYKFFNEINQLARICDPLLPQRLKE